MSMMVIDPYRFAAADTFIMQYRQDVMGWSSVDGSSGMTWTRSQSSSMLSGGISGQANVADADDGDYMEWFFNLAAGTYELTFCFYRDGYRCISTWSIDGVDIGTVDLYGSNAFNVIGTISSITVAADGNYTVKARANGKNASSSDYLLGIVSVTMTRTGA